MNTSNFLAFRKNWEIPTYDTAFWLERSKDFCVVIPVINEGQRIQHLLHRMQQIKISSLADIIIIDGGSTDNSLEIDALRNLDIRGLLIKTGAGKLSAQLRCAYAFSIDAGYEGIITIDGNDKDDPEAIEQFVAALKHGVDFVQASRYIPGGYAENTPLIRHFAIKFLHAPVLRLFSGFKWTDTTQGFRAYSRKMLLDPQINPFRKVFVNYELLAYLSYRCPRLGYKCQELPTTRRYPADGTVPTKISSFRGNWVVLSTLLKACLGRFNPRGYN